MDPHQDWGSWKRTRDAGHGMTDQGCRMWVPPPQRGSHGCPPWWVPTLPGLAAVHSEVGGFVGLQPRLLHAWPIDLHPAGVAALTHVHLWRAQGALPAGTQGATNPSSCLAPTVWDPQPHHWQPSTYGTHLYHPWDPYLHAQHPTDTPIMPWNPHPHPSTLEVWALHPRVHHPMGPLSPPCLLPQHPPGPPIPTSP